MLLIVIFAPYPILCRNWSVSHSLVIHPHPFYLAGMLLGSLVVVDAYEEYVAGIFGHLGRIVLLLDLADGSVGRLVVFQLYDKCGFGYIAPGNQHKVGIALSGGILTVDNILILCTDVGDGEDAGK